MYGKTYHGLDATSMSVMCFLLYKVYDMGFYWSKVLKGGSSYRRNNKPSGANNAFVWYPGTLKLTTVR